MTKILVLIIRFFLKLLIKMKFSFSKKRKNCDKNYIKNELKYVEKEIYDNECFKSLNRTIENDITIIIPVYNAEKYLGGCLDSILNQKTKYKYNVICVNDGSKDKSLEILKKYKEKYSNLEIIDQNNKGISGARNTGINYANGKYIGFIDNDDYVSEDYIETILNRAFEKKSDIVKCNHVNYLSNEDNRIVDVAKNADASIKGELNKKILNYKGYIWGGAFKREMFDDVRFPLGYWYEDMIMHIILMRKCRQFDYIDKNLYFYNIHNNNASKIIWKSNNPKCLDQFFLAKKLVEYSNKIDIKDKGELYYILLQELGFVLWFRTRKMNKKYQKEIFNLACSYIKNFKSGQNTSFEEIFLSKSLENNDYILWKLISIYIMLGKKYLGK